MTKKYKKLHLTFKWLSITITLIPIFVYFVLGFINGEIRQKITLGLMLILAITFVLINIILKRRIRCVIWVLLIGIYCSVDNILPLLLILATTTILDEFVFEPLEKKYYSLYQINKEIDKRGGGENGKS